MRIAAITTFPPSKYPESNFAYHAIRRLINIQEIAEIIVLSDITEESYNPVSSSKLTIERCWRYNSIGNIFSILLRLHKHKPDVVWLNLQYTLFGSKLMPAFLGTLLPAILKLLNYKTVLLLHDYLSTVDLNSIGIYNSRFARICIYGANHIVLKSLSMSDVVFTMVDTHKNHLSSKYPKARIHYIEQDLYQVPPFHPICTLNRRVVTLGYFGSYKRLDGLIEAFIQVCKHFPDAELIIGGNNSTHTPRYIDDLAYQYSNINNIKFVGYIKDEDIPNFFWSSNIVCVTNIANPGSSAVLRLAAAHGRGVLVPHFTYYQALNENWGIEYYDPHDTNSLSSAIINLFLNADNQTQMALKNHKMAMQITDEFMKAHIQAFRDIMGM